MLYMFNKSLNLCVLKRLSDNVYIIFKLFKKGNTNYLIKKLFEIIINTVIIIKHKLKFYY